MKPTRYYLDSSVLVKLYVEEPGSAVASEFVATAPPGSLATCQLARIEVTSAIERRTRAGDVNSDDAAAILAQLEKDLAARFTVIELANAVVSGACLIARRHGLRAADALHLAAARLAGGEAELLLLSSDSELNAAAVADGLRVLDPTVGADRTL